MKNRKSIIALCLVVSFCVPNFITVVLEKKNRLEGIVADVVKCTAVYTKTAQMNWYA